MSAIAGIFRRDGAPVARSDLERMLDAMKRRGPDGWGIWSDGPVGLAYRKLASTPESLHEKGPLVTPRFTLAADARLDNRDDVAGWLGIGVGALADLSDSDLIAQVFEAWGERGLHDLVGDFALAIWDAPTRELILTRDHMGVRPLVYYATERFLAFASDVRALLTLAAVPRQVDDGRVADFLLDGFEDLDKTSTFFSGIVKLAGAHTLRIGADRLDIARYWSLDPDRETTLGSPGEYVEAFREQFSQAVRCRLRSARPPVAMLSGGMDSSAIVAFARALSGHTGRPLVDTLSAVSRHDPERCEETRHIRLVQAQGGVRPHELAASELSPLLPSLETLYDTSDDPFDFEINLLHCLYAKAHLDGFNVVLDGLAGDIVASSFHHLPFLLRQGQWAAAAGAARGYARYYGRSYRTARTLLKVGRHAVVPEWVRRLSRDARLRLEPTAWIDDSLVSPDLAARVDLQARRRRDLQLLPTIRASSPRHAHARSLELPTLAVAIDRYDRVAASCGVESRHPFLDRRFAQFCLSLPWQQKFDGWTKIGLRRATAGLLPDAVRWRRSFQHLGPDFTRALLGHHDPLARRLFEDRLGQLDPFVSTPTVSRRYRRYRQTGGTADDCGDLWSVLRFGMWLDRVGAVDLGMKIGVGPPSRTVGVAGGVSGEVVSPHGSEDPAS